MPRKHPFSFIILPSSSDWNEPPSTVGSAVSPGFESSSIWSQPSLAWNFNRRFREVGNLTHANLWKEEGQLVLRGCFRKSIKGASGRIIIPPTLRCHQPYPPQYLPCRPYIRPHGFLVLHSSQALFSPKWRDTRSHSSLFSSPPPCYR